MAPDQLDDQLRRRAHSFLRDRAERLDLETEWTDLQRRIDDGAPAVSVRAGERTTPLRRRWLPVAAVSLVVVSTVALVMMRGSGTVTTRSGELIDSGVAVSSSDVPAGSMSTTLAPATPIAPATNPDTIPPGECSTPPILDAVAGLFPENDRWNPAAVEVAECNAGYARVFAIADQSICPAETPRCLNDEQVFLQLLDGVWVYIDSGSGINCADSSNSETLTVACQALGLTDADPSSDTTVDQADEWIPAQPSLPEPLQSAEVVRLLPSSLPGGQPLQSVELEPQGELLGRSYVQILTTSDGAEWLQIETTTSPLGAPAETVTREPIGPWRVHQRPPGLPSSEGLVLTYDDITVTLSSNSLDTDTLSAVATSLRTRSEPGWAIGFIPDGYLSVAETPHPGSQHQLVTQTDGRQLLQALEVHTDNPKMLAAAETGTQPGQVIDFDGTRAVLTSTSLFDGQVARTLTWPLDDRTTVRYGMLNVTTEELLSAARLIQPATAEEWSRLDIIGQDGPGSGGCPSYWC